MIELASSFYPATTEDEIKARDEYTRLYDQYSVETDAEKQEVMALGGLRIIGTERHESRRIDNQLRGRSGRQGDPGSSVFYISADDDLSRVFGSDRLKRMAQAFKVENDMHINWRMFSRNVETAQKKVEGFNYSSRKNVIEFDNVLNRQRAEVYGEREKILNGEDIHAKILDMITELAAETVEDIEYDDPETADTAEINKKLEEFLLEPGSNYITNEMLLRYSEQELADKVAKKAVEKYEDRYATNTKNGFNIAQLERDVFLRNLDKRWIDHIDDMDNLKMGIGLRGYANHDPVVAYQEEGSDMFDEMISSVRREVAKFLLALPIITIERQNLVKVKLPTKPNENLQTSANGKPQKPKTITKQPTVGRNDPCPCGSGKKYKNCCGR
jgi:preprotein translocase subunit SecA